MGQVFPKNLPYVNFAGMVSEMVCVEMLSWTCRSNLVSKVVIKAFLRKPCGNGFRNVFTDSLWKVKWQPFRNLLCYLGPDEKLFFLLVCNELARQVHCKFDAW
ncbi:hypothetical protein AVEN_154960-1 [Araneus ventricosus]|uniref:Uncharacterized protein n=1 Tax=Araneus ventricosus TaxID=182803 RepID=A0A4Y2A8I9_ARAVE|nr:hypothetical protein AVEN_154960-1 [Araneus ventricosus]